MGFINLAEKTVHAKLVYYGIGAGGKTTSLQAVHGIMCPSNEVKLVSINTEEDATLLFDFLPISLGSVEGYQIVIQGFTVPGQPKYKLMRKYVLQGADAVVLVVDSQRSRLEENVEALEGLKENLRLNGLDPDSIPIIIQYNKRDLDDILSEEELNEHFLFREGVQAFPSVATESQGVYETFVHAASTLVETKIKQYNLGKGAVGPEQVAAAAQEKLWSIFDDYRALEEKREQERLALTLQDEEVPRQIPPSGGDEAEDDRIDPGGERIDLSQDNLDLGGDVSQARLRARGMGEEQQADGERLSISGPKEKSPLELEDEADDEFELSSEAEQELELSSESDADDELGLDELEEESTVLPADAALDAAADELLEDLAGEIFSDAELDVALDMAAIEEPAYEPEAEEPVVEQASGLLDRALQSNLQLAEAYGELDRYKAALERKNEELVKIAQNTVHDLNKPLSAIKLMLSSANKGYLGEVNENLGCGIMNALQACQMMERLIGDLMDSMRLDQAFKMVFDTVDMSHLVNDVLNTLQYPLDEKNVQVEVAELPTIEADEWGLTKAFMNLLGNAIQYSAEDRDPRLWVEYEEDEDNHVFTIRDNGIGIPEGQIDKLFLRFERGSNTGGISGTGLGLHIVKEVVMGHGGGISVESDEGEGSTFRLHLPKQPVEVPISAVSQTVEL